jgi:23S rRNA (cytidine1920-2'-O)/16S rRNA (cytidine1409-2'-O)-methyltransferase
MRRADDLVLAQGLAETRSQARRLILDHKITASGSILKKPGQLIPSDTQLAYNGAPPFVSRAGDKLENFLQKHPLPLANQHALDIGASTGGFTDCLLRRDVTSVICIDVGHKQLHPRLAADPRVTNYEGVNARELPSHLPLCDIAVVDLSFISLKLVLPEVWKYIRPDGHLIALIKPQFEAGKAICDACGGIIRDPALRTQIVADIISFVRLELPRSQLIAGAPSTVIGGDGNHEYLACWQKTSS